MTNRYFGKGFSSIYRAPINTYENANYREVYCIWGKGVAEMGAKAFRVLTGVNGER